MAGKNTAGGAGGRPKHDFWVTGEFEHIIKDKKPAALCKICGNDVRNTAKVRLLQHRKVCHKTLLKSNDDNNNTDSENKTEIEMVEDQSDEYIKDTIVDSTETESMFSGEVDSTDSIDHDYASQFHSDHGIRFAEEVISTDTSDEVPLTTSILKANKIKSSGNLLSFLSSRPNNSVRVTCNSNEQTKNEFKAASNLTVRRLSSSSSSLQNKGTSRATINSYIDWLTMEEKEQIDKSLAKYIFGCNIPFSTVESDHLKNLIKKLRPAYKVPSRKTLATVLLDQIYEEINTEDCLLCEKESVLLIDGWKNSTANTKNVVTMIHNNYGHVAFLQSFDMSEQSETGEELARIVLQAKQLAMEKFGTKIYAVSDNASNMLKMGRLINISGILHSGCNSHMGNVLPKEIVDRDIIDKVTPLQREFKSPNLEKKLKKRVVLSADTRWCSHRDTYENFLTNLSAMRQIVIDEQCTVKSPLKSLLFDDDFIENVRMQKEALDPVCNLVNQCQQRKCSLADAVKLWLDLKVPAKYDGNLKKRQEKVFTDHALAAYYVHPQYIGENLNIQQLQIAEYYLFANLSRPGIESLQQFKSSVGIFGILSKKENLSPLAFWESAQHHANDLAHLATKLLKIPASSAQLERVFSNWSYVHCQLRNRLTGDRSKKLVNVYYSLKTKDTNLSNEY